MQEDEEESWHNTHGENDRHIDVVTIKPFILNSIRSVLMTKTRNKYQAKAEKIEYNIKQAVLAIYC